MAWGFSLELVLALMKLLSVLAAAFSSIRSLMGRRRELRPGGSLPIHIRSSAKRASNSWGAVGLVRTVFCGNLVRMCQMAAQARVVVFPTPWPALTESLGFPAAMALRMAA